jgi:hypothetical protein
MISRERVRVRDIVKLSRCLSQQLIPINLKVFMWRRAKETLEQINCCEMTFGALEHDAERDSRRRHSRHLRSPRRISNASSNKSVAPDQSRRVRCQATTEDTVLLVVISTSSIILRFVVCSIPFRES